MQFKKKYFAVSFLVAALAGCSAEATTPIIDAETPLEAIEAYISGVCEGNHEQVIHQMRSPERSGESSFEPALNAAQRQCERYGGFSAFNAKRISETRLNSNIVDGVIEFQDGTETNINQRVYVYIVDNYYKVASSTPKLCFNTRGCFE